MGCVYLAAVDLGWVGLVW